MSSRIDYGQDAPGLMRGFLGAAIAVWVAVVMIAVFGNGFWAWFGIALLGFVGLYLTFMGCFMIYESKIGKVRDRARILDLVSWRGQENVLDLGCGRGLMMIGAALRVPDGRVIGIDLW